MSSPAITPNMREFTASDALAQNWWAIAIRGLAAVIFGIAAIFWPAAAMLTFVFLFAAYLLIDGVFSIVAAVRAIAGHQRWAWLLIEGLLDFIMAGVALFFPASAIFAFVLITASWALITGALMLMSGFKLDASHGRWWMLLGGVISVLWAIALVIAPMIGALVLTWWIAGYAIAFGITLIVLSLRLRAQSGPRSSGLAVH
ncbi:MAG TPA: HdeD family acid-resistance protein [Rhizomicrobium sp.]|jgi:uncharacterized membrane protein HdeD (DUF308 family)|nr:HdeD family acid-resistance protein [Rhizomicrobium sp.]